MLKILKILHVRLRVMYVRVNFIMVEKRNENSFTATRARCSRI